MAELPPKAKRAPPHCSVCRCPNKTKRTCKHCWDGWRCEKPECENGCNKFGYCWSGKRCHKLECKKCEGDKGYHGYGHGQNYGKVVKMEQCQTCTKLTATHYENGVVVRVADYDTCSSCEYGYDGEPDDMHRCPECNQVLGKSQGKVECDDCGRHLYTQYVYGAMIKTDNDNFEKCDTCGRGKEEIWSDDEAYIH